MGEHGKNYVVILMICNLRHCYRDYQTKEYEMGTVCRTQQEKLLRVLGGNNEGKKLQSNSVKC